MDMYEMMARITSKYLYTITKWRRACIPVFFFCYILSIHESCCWCSRVGLFSRRASIGIGRVFVDALNLRIYRRARAAD